MVTPEVALPYLQGVEHHHRDKVHFRRPAASDVEATLTPEAVLHNFLANELGNSGHFPSELTPPAVLASPEQGSIEQAQFVEDGVEVEDIVEPLGSEVVDSVVPVAAAGQRYVAKLVVVVEKVDIADGPSDYFAGQVQDIEIVVEQFVVGLGVAASEVVQPTAVQAAGVRID